MFGDDLSTIITGAIILWFVASRLWSRFRNKTPTFESTTEPHGTEEWWAVLEVMPDASRAEIDHAYRVKAERLSRGMKSLPAQDEITKRARQRAVLEEAYRGAMKARPRTGSR